MEGVSLLEKLDLLLLKFVEHMKINGFAERTVITYELNVRFFLNYLKTLEIENIAEVDRRILNDYQAAVYLETHKGKPLAPSSQQGRLIAVKAFYRYLIKTGIVLYDPTTVIDLPRRPDSIPRNILNKKEISTLLSAPNLETPLGIRDRAIFELLYSTGIRAGELRNLTLDDVDFNHGEVRINKGKGKKDRIVPLGEMASDYLEFYLQEARPKLAPVTQAALFVTKSGKKLGKSDLSDLTERYRARAGMKKYFTPHSLRHTCATHMLKGKADIRQIQELLGHASIANTQIYTRVEVSDLKRVMKRCHPRERREIEAHEL